MFITRIDDICNSFKTCCLCGNNLLYSVNRTKFERRAFAHCDKCHGHFYNGMIFYGPDKPQEVFDFCYIGLIKFEGDNFQIYSRDKICLKINDKFVKSLSGETLNRLSGNYYRLGDIVKKAILIS